jgi:2-oxoisovalerate dehydrogenase E2 component (dihydrolipoyl transacylase)
MIKDFILPDIGEGIIECEVVEWKVKEGDVIVEDQIVADVSTDKAIVEIPSMYNGVITKLYYAEGDIAQVHSPLFAIDAEGDGEAAAPEEAPAKSDVSVEPNASVDLAPAVPEEDITTGKVLSTPAVRRLARENALDLALVSGTGKAGRVLKEDLLRYLANPAVEVSASAGTPSPTPVSSAESDRVEAIRGVRKIMAERMSESVATIPHFTYVDEIDITELVELRLQLKERYAPDGIRVTMMPLFIKAMSLAIKQFPVLNSRANDEFTELTYLADHNIGMAVDGKTGLLVPNIKGVQSLSILDVAQEVSRLTEAARSGKISPADLSGGTITLSNVGAIGGTAATPIITKPEVAIVALGKVQTLPRFDAAGNVVARKIMTVSWSGDHRVIDGATMARFSNQWKEYLEVPSSMLASMV